MRSKFLKAIAGSGILLLALTGCVDLESSIDIRDDGTATVEYQYLIQNDYLKQMGMAPEQYEEAIVIKNDTSEILKTETGTGLKSVKEVIWEGENANYGSKSVEEALKVASTDPEARDNLPTLIKREGDNIAIGFPLYPTEEPTDEPGQMSVSDVGPEAIFDSFIVSATFPGDVKEASHGGKIDGHTVTWNLDSVVKSMEAKEVLTATGASSEGGAISFPIIIILVVALLGLGAGGFFLFKTLRRQKEDNDNDEYIDGLKEQHGPAIAELKRQADLEKQQSQTDALKAWQAAENEELPPAPQVSQTPQPLQTPLPPQGMQAPQALSATPPPKALPPLRMPPKPKIGERPFLAEGKPAPFKLPPLPPLPPKKL